MRGGTSRTLAALVLFWTVLFLVGLAALDVDTSLEGFRVAVAQRMLRTGDWIVPHLADQPYFKKPPLCPWTIALASLPTGGVTAFSARIPSALAVLATSLLILGLGRRWGRPRVGAFAAFLYLLLPLVVEKGRRAEIEASLALLAFAGLAAMLEGLRTLDARASRRLTLLGWAATGLALLDKGPPALVFVIVPLLLVLILRRGKGFRPADHAGGAALAVGIFAAWLVPLVLRTGWEPLWSTFRHETLERATSERIHNAAPLWYYLVVFPAGAGPALLFLPWLRPRTPGERERVIVLVLAVVAPFVLFSFFAGKDDRYLLPLYPWVALLGGFGAVRFLDRLERPGKGRIERIAVVVGIVGAFVGGGVLAWALAAPAARPLAEAVVLGAAFALSAAAAGSLLLRGRSGPAVVCLLLAAAVLPIAFLRGYVPARNAVYSPRPMAETMLALTPPGTSIRVPEQIPPQVLVYLEGRARILRAPLSGWEEAADGEVWAWWLPHGYGAERLEAMLLEGGDRILQDRALAWRRGVHRFVVAARGRRH